MHTTPAHLKPFIDLTKSEANISKIEYEIEQLWETVTVLMMRI